MGRSNWIQFFMETAEHVSTMCTCAAGRKVGAVFVRNKRILTTGFNGVPAGYPHPLVCVRKQEGVPSGEGLHKCACMHAESNGIANAAKEGVSLNGSTLYATSQPCVMCMGALANVGVKEVIYRDPYHHELSKEIALHAEISVLKYVTVSNIGLIDLECHTE